MKMTRMWVNQPSTLQPHHDLHGENVLAHVTGDDVVRVYFTHGPVISQDMQRIALDRGWNDTRVSPK